MKKILIGDISGHRDFSEILFDFMAGWRRTILPFHLAAFLQGKNAWDKKLKTEDVVLKDDTSLLMELKEQLLSGAKSLSHFKLFVERADYTDGWQLRLQEIIDFYQEVFRLEIRKIKPVPLPPGYNFMLFPREIIISSEKMARFWEEYRNGGEHEKSVDRALSYCEPAGCQHSVSPQRFIGCNIRPEARNYLLAYKCDISQYRQESGDESDEYFFRIPGRQNDGITLREGYLLLLFEWWRNRRFFTAAEEKKCAAVPCFGSTGAAGKDGSGYFPVPIIFLTNDAMTGTGVYDNLRMSKITDIINYAIADVKYFSGVWKPA